MAIKIVPVQLLLYASITILILFHCVAFLLQNYFCRHTLINPQSVLSHNTWFNLCYLEICHMNYILEFHQPYLCEAMWAKSQFITSRIVSLLIKDMHHKSGVGRGDTLLFCMCQNRIQGPLKLWEGQSTPSTRYKNVKTFLSSNKYERLLFLKCKERNIK